MRFIKWIFGFSTLLLGVTIIVAAYSKLSGKNSSEVKNMSVNIPEREVERLIREGDFTGLTDAKLESIPKTEFSFYKDYIQASRECRSMLVTVLKSISQPWCFKYFHALLRDSDRSIRSEAAQGIFLLDKDVDAEKILLEIGRLNGGDPKERIFGLPQLILSVGNSRNSESLDALLEQSLREAEADVKTEYQKATAKLGFKKSIREIELELVSGDGFSKTASLAKVLYIDNPEWIEKVIPLLYDEEAGFSIPFGTKTLTRRVCDIAVDVLRKIDPLKRIDLQEKPPGIRYTDDEMGRVRMAYRGLTK